MPDFFDRLVARGARPGGGGSGGAAAPTSGPARLAGMTVVRPRVPGLFERPAPPAPDRELEVTAEPPLSGLGLAGPPSGAAPGSPPQPRTHTWLVAAPVAHRGAEQAREPSPPPQPAPVTALLPAAPQFAPSAAAAPAAPARRQDTPHPVSASPGREPAGGPGAQTAPQALAPPVPAAPPQAPAPPAWRPPAPAPAGAAPATRPPHAGTPTEPTVRISIGRIEVRAPEPPGHRGADRRPGRPAPVLSLDRFLAGEAGQR